MRASGFVVLEESSRFLLIQESSRKRKGAWYFPGGKIEAGENIKAGTIREVKEESGMIVELVSLFYIKYYEGEDDKMELFFKGKITGGSLKQTADKESLNAGWFTLKEIKEMKLRENAWPLIKLSMNQSGTIPVDNFKIYADKFTRPTGVWKRLLHFLSGRKN
ncbi:MAG: NUDIX hydrolase [Bacteroidota bacterium]